MNRHLQKELLDELPPTDPRAIGSRRDLRRLNGLMGNASILSTELASFSNGPSTHLVDIGAGDANLLLQVARRLGARWRGTRATLLDRCNMASPGVYEAFRALGWEIDWATTDIFDWCGDRPTKAQGIIMTNLFLHHFDSEALTRLMGNLALRCSCFIALEPRRGPVPLLFSRLVRLIGCNRVTRHDAPASVRAGFAGKELSKLWPDSEHWIIRERRAGPFGHLFTARLENAGSHELA